MKTNEELNSTQQDADLKSISTKLNPMLVHPIKSIRPQRSMVRVQSLRPKRMQVATKTKNKA